MSQALAELYLAFKSQTHPEIWGITLEDPVSHVPSQIIFQKFLNANQGDLDEAKNQLLLSLQWRSEMRPLELMTEAFPRAKYGDLGFVTTYGAEHDPTRKEIIVWNTYTTIAQRMEETLSDTDDFIRWRVALMELSIVPLRLVDATQPITADNDPYKIHQVHDCANMSIFKQKDEVRASIGNASNIFIANYPELLKEKFLVNMPMMMGFFYSFLKMFVDSQTSKKFHSLSKGKALAKELKSGSVSGLQDALPTAYGGKGADLATQGQQTALV
ncbi:hypothetical protein FDECE_1895 [Fusarium decemcellulare]|nr:hypothetical protein FDECE_1895 [Fusarium decemcellulare]